MVTEILLGLVAGLVGSAAGLIAARHGFTRPVYKAFQSQPDPAGAATEDAPRPDVSSVDIGRIEATEAGLGDMRARMDDVLRILQDLGRSATRAEAVSAARTRTALAEVEARLARLEFALDEATEHRGRLDRDLARLAEQSAHLDRVHKRRDSQAATLAAIDASSRVVTTMVGAAHEADVPCLREARG